MHTKLKRHLLFKKLLTLDIEDTLEFPLLPDESIKVAANRIITRLYHSPYYDYNFKIKIVGFSIYVTKVSERPLPVFKLTCQP